MPSQGNIFSLKFVPFTNDAVLVSGAGDNQVRVHDAVRGETTHVFTPHGGRVKRLEVAQDEPHLIWSAGEDGLVM
jgi:WD and tetratricopeptide repeat-containing protein 1